MKSPDATDGGAAEPPPRRVPMRLLRWWEGGDGTKGTPEGTWRMPETYMPEVVGVVSG